MPGQNLTTALKVLKVYYNGQRVKDLVYPEEAFLGSVAKMTTFSGKNMDLPVEYSRSQNISPVFAAGQAAGTVVKYDAFVIERNENFGFGFVNNHAARASMSEKGAFIKLMKNEIDQSLKELSRNLAIDLFGDGTGELGLVESATDDGDTCTIILQKEGSTTTPSAALRAATISNFSYNQWIQIIDIDGTLANGERPFVIGGTNVGGVLTIGNATTLAATGFQISARSVSASSITISADVASSIAKGDIIVGLGKRDNTVAGLQAWLPPSAAAIGTFKTVERDLDRTRLGGIYSDGSSESNVNALIDGLSFINSEGAMIDKLWNSYARFAKIVKDLSATGSLRYSKEKRSDSDSAAIGYEALAVVTSRGTVPLMADYSCPDNLVFALKMDAVKLYSLDDVPLFEDLDGNKVLRQGAANGIEARLAYYAELGVNAPGFCGVIRMPNL